MVAVEFQRQLKESQSEEQPGNEDVLPGRIACLEIDSTTRCSLGAEAHGDQRREHGQAKDRGGEREHHVGAVQTLRFAKLLGSERVRGDGVLSDYFSGSECGCGACGGRHGSSSKYITEVSRRILSFAQLKRAGDQGLEDLQGSRVRSTSMALGIRADGVSEPGMGDTAQDER